MLDKQTCGTIICLSARGHSIHSISRLLSVSRKTVGKVVHAGADDLPRVRRPSILEPCRGRIGQLLSEYGCNLLKVHKALTGSGVEVSYPTLTRFCRQNHIVDANTNLMHSTPAVREWLAGILNGARTSECLKAELDDATDLPLLLRYMKHGRAGQRKKAATILARKRGIPNAIIARTLHSSQVTTRDYYTIYAEAGVEKLFGRTTRLSTTQSQDCVTIRRIIELLHHKPATFGINRTSWTQTALRKAYEQAYSESITRYTLTRIVRNAGYRWKKARRVLTSPDPNYRDKVELLLKTLQSLTASDMFFFLDEWGPVQVKKRGGKAYRTMTNATTIPRHQATKGSVSLVGALSATTNFITWAFVNSKDSRSMINILEMLYNQYHTASKLYVTWDAVSWHNSALLIEWLDRFNEKTRECSAGPIIELVPLPTSAQFLNVIEGVLSAMTRAVVNNSDYQTPVEMKKAISRHFTERNEHFKDNPRRAGKKIWEMDFFNDFNTLRGGDYREW